MKRNEVVIPFQKENMTMGDMARAVGALEAIIVRWHAVEAKRKAIENVEEGWDIDEYEKLVDEFFWDVHQQINQFSTWKVEEDKKND